MNTDQSYNVDILKMWHKAMLVARRGVQDSGEGCEIYVTQYNKRYILSTLEKIEMIALSNGSFNKLSYNTKFVKIEVILL